MGLPKAIQSDQGSNFVSGTFQQVMHELGIKQYTSSAYHPLSQRGSGEFPPDFKKHDEMSYYYQQGKDWDDGIHLLLREAVII